MLSQLKNYFRKIPKWQSSTSVSNGKKYQSSLLLSIFMGLLESVLFWNKPWISVSFIIFCSFFLLICIHQEINLFQFVIGLCTLVLCGDLFECWLKFKHRTGCLKKLITNDGSELYTILEQLGNWIHKQWMHYVFIRDTNHAKAFLIVSIIFGTLFILGTFVNGYLLTYIFIVLICMLKKIAPPVLQILKKIQQNAESDYELEGLVPDASDANIKLLNIEPEHEQKFDERQSLDYWKPDDMHLDEDGSDSSDHSSSIVTNLSKDNIKVFEGDIETSDSSEDEYIPSVPHKEQFQSTLEEQPTSTWSSSAYNALSSITGAVTNMMYSAPQHKKPIQSSSADSSDGFEIIDKSDVM